LRATKWGGDKPTSPRRGRWSQSEVARLRELYGLRDERSIARELGRPVASVRKMAHNLFPAAARTGPWSAREVLDLRKYLGGASIETVARILGRSIEDVQHEIENLRRAPNPGRWTQAEVAEFKRLYGTRDDEDLAVIFGRGVDAVRRLAAKLCLAKDKAFRRKVSGPRATRMPRWKRVEIEKLVEIYPVAPNLDIAQTLNRSVKSVVSKAHNLGLKKEAERLREMGRENVSMRYRKGGAPMQG
jgi:hypothetical protein